MDYKDFTSEDFAQDGFFIRWVKGEEDTQWFWESFLKEHSEKAESIREARHLVSSFAFPDDELPQESFDSMRNNLIMALRAKKEKDKEHHAPYSAGRNNYWLKIAAAVLLVIISGVVLYSLRTGNEIDVNNLVASKDQEQRQNPRGQKSIIQLTDGTKIWLNADSKLTYSKDFNTGVTRDVYLDGEAFFEVAHNASRPFFVHTSELDIRVLGTSFNVKSYKEDKKIETTLLEGQVKIFKANMPEGEASLILAPNQKAIFQKQTQVLDVEQVQAERISAWRQDKLVFDETTYGEVITQLERWYDVQITVQGNTNLECKLTASIEKESLEDVLNLLVTSHKISYTMDGNKIFITGTLCQPN